MDSCWPSLVVGVKLDACLSLCCFSKPAVGRVIGCRLLVIYLDLCTFLEGLVVLSLHGPFVNGNPFLCMTISMSYSFL